MKEFLFKKNVVLVRPGTKIKNGKDTGRPCITIGVSKKLPKSKLGSGDFIPIKTRDGKETDIIIQKPLRALNSCPDADPDDGCSLHTDKIRPLIGGISIGRATASVTGTGGLLVVDSLDGKIVYLSNNHVIALQFDPNFDFPTGGNLDPTINRFIQPSLLDDGLNTSDYWIGYGKRCVPIQFGSLGENRVDAGVIELDDLSETMTDILHQHIGPFPWLADNEVNAGDLLWKSGRSTGNTSGIVTAVGVAANVSYINDDPNNVGQFVDQILIETTGKYAGPGDSGSVVTHKTGGSHRIAGLLFAGSDDRKTTLINPMGTVASEMQIEEWDGKVSLAPGTLPVQSVHYRCYNVTEDYTLGDASHLAQRVFASCDECLRFQFKNDILGNVV